jgi:group I intron endonuclease
VDKNPVSGIYVISNVFNDNKYIGGTVNLVSRKRQHFSDLRHNRSGSVLMQQDWNDIESEIISSEDWFSFSVLEKVSEDKLLEREQYWLDNLQPVYNTNKIAGKYIGEYIRTLEAKEKAKQSRSRKKPVISDEVTENRRERWLGDNNPNRKTPYTEEHREHLRQSMLGEKNPNFGLKRSEETLQKMKNSHFKTYHNILSPDGTFYETIQNMSNFCKEHDLGVSSMVAIAHHRKKSHKGWTCTDVLSDV